MPWHAGGKLEAKKLLLLLTLLPCGMHFLGRHKKLQNLLPKFCECAIAIWRWFYWCNGCGVSRIARISVHFFYASTNKRWGNRCTRDL